MGSNSKNKVREQFRRELKHHLAGWLEKFSSDFSEREFKRELANLKKDSVYTAFGFAIPEYVLIRLMGRVSISIGRRLGEIYDKIPRIITQARFKLSEKEVAPKIAQKLELDICVPLAHISKTDARHVANVVWRHLQYKKLTGGLGIEIRYNFNPNDSARLRKDVDMANLLKKAKLLPVYLIFSSISPRDEAIARLKRAGWTFLVGDKASKFMQTLIGMDFEKSLREVRNDLDSEVAKIMREIYTSHAMRKTLEPYYKKLVL